MKCPACKSEPLVRGKYESVSVHQCRRCEGHLVRSGRLNAIKNSKAEVSVEVLTELMEPNENDTFEKLLCPGCLRTMDEHKKKVLEHEFLINQCERCTYVWFDQRELQKFKVHFELSARGEDMQRFRDRIESLTDQERQELARRMDALEDGKLFDRDDYLMWSWMWSR